MTLKSSLTLDHLHSNGAKAFLMAWSMCLGMSISTRVTIIVWVKGGGLTAAATHTEIEAVGSEVYEDVEIPAYSTRRAGSLASAARVVTSTTSIDSSGGGLPRSKPSHKYSAIILGISLDEAGVILTSIIP